MAANTNFAVALHALSVLAYREQVTPSSMIAQSVNTNAVVVRRVMGKLGEAGIVRSVPGKNGGFELALPARKVRLAAVLRAVDDGALFKVHDNPENPECGVSCGIKPVLENVLARVDQAVGRELGKMTLADVMTAM